MGQAGSSFVSARAAHLKISIKDEQAVALIKSDRAFLFVECYPQIVSRLMRAVFLLQRGQLSIVANFRNRRLTLFFITLGETALNVENCVVSDPDCVQRTLLSFYD